ncbi:MAG TPA: energy transducer TonB [Anaeromyxobacteraceae bacterium]|nr:energy transducer TonB [Anaeromyxobacteraceae bacterium]
MTAAVLSHSPLSHSPLFGRRERLWPLVIVTLSAHAGLFALALFAHPVARLQLDQKPIVARLVRLGEKPPPHLLPRKEPAAPAPAAPKETAPAEPAKPAPATAPAQVAKAEPAAKKRDKKAGRERGDVLASVLSRVRAEQANSEPLYGDPQGDPEGDTSSASEGDQYLALVERALRESYVLPATISERDRQGLKATVVLFLDPDGRVLRYQFESRSGNPAFDNALERAIWGARIPPPPEQLRDRYRREGLGVVYRP